MLWAAIWTDFQSTFSACFDETTLNSFDAAIGWISNLLSGSLATALLIIAVAMIGYSLLLGHLSARKGITLSLGILFVLGSSQLARSLVGSIPHYHSSPPLTSAYERPPPLRLEEEIPEERGALVGVQAGNPFDPYRGANTTD